MKIVLHLYFPPLCVYVNVHMWVDVLLQVIVVLQVLKYKSLIKPSSLCSCLIPYYYYYIDSDKNHLLGVFKTLLIRSRYCQRTSSPGCLLGLCSHNGVTSLQFLCSKNWNLNSVCVFIENGVFFVIFYQIKQQISVSFLTCAVSLFIFPFLW